MVQIDPDHPVLTHTYFEAPSDVDIADIDTGFGQHLPLFMTLKPLLAAPGRIQSFWSRIEEDPNKVVLVTGQQYQMA